jgi:exodeoxyribonuclease VII small subunit
MSTTSPTDFETAMAELDQIVRTLEQGDLPLEQSLTLFERGVRLSRFCHDRLEDAEKRIQVLTERGGLKDATEAFDQELGARTPDR